MIDLDIETRARRLDGLADLVAAAVGFIGLALLVVTPLVLLVSAAGQ